MGFQPRRDTVAFLHPATSRHPHPPKLQKITHTPSGKGLQLGAGTNEHGLIFAFSPLILGEGIATTPALPSGAHPHDPSAPLLRGAGDATEGAARLRPSPPRLSRR